MRRRYFMSSRSTETIAFVVLGAFASLAENALCEKLVDPQLPFPGIPIWWWLGIYFPSFLVHASAGWVGASVLRTAALCGLAVWPSVLATFVQGVDPGMEALFVIGMTPRFFLSMLIGFASATARCVFNRRIVAA